MASIATDLAKTKTSALGVGTNTNPVKYLNQDFETLRAQCLASGTLFEDPEFPASQSSLGVNHLGPKSDAVKGLVWRRPSEIKKNPLFIHEGATRADVRQGILGDCWFLSSVASLTLNKDCLCQVVPGDQSFDKDYAGIFHFKIWLYGEWVDVVVDDRLPTKEGKLLFLKSTTANEFWSALLEKAFAKIHGSYEALKGGISLEALECFTAGVGEMYYIKDAPSNLFQIIQKALRTGSLIACCTKYDKSVKGYITKTNLAMLHSYSLTGAEEVTCGGDKVQIVRVRNPWGYTEWNGAWSDDAKDWDKVDVLVKSQLNIKCDDGESWMPFPCFLDAFSRVDICHLTLDYVCSDKSHKWCLTEFKGKWTVGSTAGGCQEYATYWTNPQFCFTLEDPDGDYRRDPDAPCCTVVVSLMQTERRRKRPQGEDFFELGYDIYKIPKETGSSISMGMDFFDKNEAIARSGDYTNIHEVSNRFQLPVGKYLIVPTTYDANQEVGFLLRIFSEKTNSAL